MNMLQTAMSIALVAATTSVMATTAVQPQTMTLADVAKVQAEQVQTAVIDTKDATIVEAVEAKNTAVTEATEAKDAVVTKTTEVKDATVAKTVEAKDAAVAQATDAKDTVISETTEVKETVAEQVDQAEEKADAVKTEEKKGFFSWFKKKAA